MAIGRYIWAAIWTRYNLLALVAVGAGIVLWRGPWFWLAVLAVELLYLFMLATQKRFQTVVDAHARARSAQQAEDAAVMQLRGDAQRSFRQLKRDCEAMLARVAAIAPGLVELHRQELSRLGGVYLELLLARQALRKTLDPAGDAPPAAQVAAADARLADGTLPSDVRESLQGQRDLLQQRQTVLAEIARKADFVSAEITRIELQVKLLRDQIALTSSPDKASEKIAEITATLRGTTRWMNEQRELVFAGESGASAPASVTLQSPLRQ